MPIDAGVHSADMLRYLFGDVKWVWGETRLHEKVRYNTHSAGPGGIYARWTASFPDQIEPTGDDALYAQITFKSGALATWIHDTAGHGKRFGSKHVFGSKGSIERRGPIQAGGYMRSVSSIAMSRSWSPGFRASS